MGWLDDVRNVGETAMKRRLNSDTNEQWTSGSLSERKPGFSLIGRATNSLGSLILLLHRFPYLWIVGNPKSVVDMF